jgi:hypothetical protein
MTEDAPAVNRVANFYEILQVSPTDGQEVIRVAFRTLARRYHPDINRSPDAALHMRRLNEAYAVLRDPTRRVWYDAELSRTRAKPRPVDGRPPRVRPHAPPPVRMQGSATGGNALVVRLVIVAVLVVLFLTAGLVLWLGDEPVPGAPRMLRPRSEGAVHLVASRPMTSWPVWPSANGYAECGPEHGGTAGLLCVQLRTDSRWLREADWRARGRADVAT